MKKIACKYAIVRFLPFVETGEFANVGVILIAPDARFFDFQLKINRYGRITQFFSELDAKTYRNAMRSLRDELKRAATNLKRRGFDRRFKDSGALFAESYFTEITRLRESIVRFSDVGAVLTDDPKATLQSLFDYYVERNFVTKEYRETTLERGIRDWLCQANLYDRFARDTIGDDEYHVTFPFVERISDVPRSIIKPLNLAHDEPTQIADHGGAWLFRLEELSDRASLPSRLLFAVDRPSGKKSLSARVKACDKIVQRLEDCGVLVVPYGEDRRSDIIEFAAR